MGSMGNLISQASSQNELANLLESDKAGIYFAKTYLSLDGVTDDYTNLYALINTTINGDDAEIWFKDGTCLVGTSITIPSNIKLVFLEGANIKPESGVIITGSNAKIESSLQKIFDIADGGTVAGTWDVEYFYPEWFGALRDGTTDDTVALQAAITLANENGGGTVKLTRGTYRCLRMFCKSNVTILGDNRMSILKSVDGRGSGYIPIWAENVTNFHIKELTIDGNIDNVEDNEQCHSVRFNKAINCSAVSCNFYGSRGDAIVILGIYPSSTYSASENIKIYDCDFTGAGRNHITLGSGYNGVYIENNRFSGDVYSSHIDSEPTLLAYTQNVWIVNNFFDGTNGGGIITTAGSSQTDYDQKFRIIGNYMLNTGIYTIVSKNVLIQGNHIIKTAETSYDYSIRVYRQGEVYIFNNYIYNYIDDNAIDIQYNSGAPKEILIQSNILKINKLVIKDTRQVNVSDNIIIGDGSTYVIYAYSTSVSGAEILTINNNLISTCTYGIYLNYASGKSIDTLRITNNVFEDCSTIAIYTTNTISYFTNFVLSNNSLQGTTPSLISDVSNITHWIIQGGGDTPTIFRVKGSPENVVTAPVGSIALRSDGSAGTSHYIKESGTGNTGWIATMSSLSGSATWDPGSLNDGVGETSASITVTGAALGDFAIASAPYDLQGVTCNAYVDATNSVKIRLQNETGGVVDLASGTWKVKVIKA